MKGQLCKNDTDRLLEELHNDREFEIFTANEKKKHSGIITYTAQNGGNRTTFHDTLQEINKDKWGIWFTINSMKHGKRKIEFIESFNAIGLDLDSGKEGDNREAIEHNKQKNMEMLLNLQLVPTVIIETKNGLQPLWFLFPGEITDNDTHNSIQRMMQSKLGADPNAIGGERLYRLPGYYHWKDASDPFLCKIVHNDYNKRYRIKELAHKFGGQRKLKELRKKSVGKRYSGKPIELKEFKGNGDPRWIADGCRALAALESKKDASHYERLALETIYINLGQAGLDHFREIARNWNDYKEDVTEYMIGQALKQGYKPTTCKWLIENGICPGKCANIASHRSPIAFYYQPYKKLDKTFKGRKMIDPDEIITRPEHEAVTDAIIAKLKKRKQTVSDSHRHALLNIAKVIDTPVSAKERQTPTIIPAVPGLGKTTFIVEYLKHRLSKNDGFGAVVVVERQGVIDDIVAKISSYCAFGMKGYEKDYCAMGYQNYKPSQCKTCDVKDCRVKTNFIRQEKYPVVVISHKRLFDMSDRDDLLGNLRTWKRVKPSNTWTFKNGKIRRSYDKLARELLLIDEKPTLLENIPTDIGMWDTLIAETNEYLPEYNDEVEKAVESVRNLYNKTTNYGKIKAVDDEFKWTKEFVDSWNDLYLGDHPEYPVILQNILREGGLYNKNEKRTITTIHYSNVYWQDYHSFIYDGTANVDPDYLEDKFQFLSLPPMREYHNLTIHLCMEQNLSKGFFEKHDTVIGRIADDIKQIASHGQTYVVCYKLYENELKQCLEDTDNVAIEHYGNTKGANHLNNNNNIVCVGILHKGESYYLSKNLTLNGDTGYDVNTTGKIRRFKDENAEAIKVYEMVTEMAQEIFRTKLRNHSSDEEIHAYICTRDANVINALREYFPGCNVVRDWEPTALLSERALFRNFKLNNEDKFKTNAKLIKAFIQEGHGLTTEDVVDVLGVDRAHAARYLK